MHKKQVTYAGEKLSEASKVLIMTHGRGGSAADILSLSQYLQLTGFALVAPQATNNTWYPNSFMAKPSENEPWLSSALALLKDLLNDIHAAGFANDKIYLLGFSQGACLTLEFVTRNAMQYGGVVAFTGGLIGDKIYSENYNGDFSGTPIFIGSSDPDPHVPVQRVNDTADVLEKMNARLTKKIYKGMGHTISQDEIEKVNELIFI